MYQDIWISFILSHVQLCFISKCPILILQQKVEKRGVISNKDIFVGDKIESGLLELLD